MSDPVILSAARTPIGSFNGAPTSVPAPELGADPERRGAIRGRASLGTGGGPGIAMVGERSG